MLLDGVADVAHKRVRLGSLHTDFQAFLGHTYQLLLLRCRLADDEHTTGVSIVAVEDGRKIHVDDITLLQHVFLLGNTVTHHLVD